MSPEAHIHVLSIQRQHRVGDRRQVSLRAQCPRLRFSWTPCCPSASPLLLMPTETPPDARSSASSWATRLRILPRAVPPLAPPPPTTTRSTLRRDARSLQGDGPSTARRSGPSEHHSCFPGTELPQEDSWAASVASLGCPHPHMAKAPTH